MLEDDYVRAHLYYMVAANLQAKKSLSQPRTWRLPLCVPRDTIELEFNTICDCLWSVLGGAATLCYIVQRYRWEEQERTSIFLYGGQVGLNSMLRPHHQLDSELASRQLAQKVLDAALETFKDFNIAPKPRLTSDSVTALTLCTKPAITLSLGVGLFVGRIQETFGGGSEGSGLHHAPGELFKFLVDLLTRHDPFLVGKLTPEFYSPSLLKPRIKDRVTTSVARMLRTSDSQLPHRNPRVMKYASFGSGLRGNLFASSPSPPSSMVGPGSKLGVTVQSSKLHSPGKGALNQDIPFQGKCGTCQMGNPVFHPADRRLLAKAREKKKNKSKTEVVTV